MLPPQATSMVNAYVSLRASVVDLSFRRSICSKSMRKSSSSTSSGACITCKLTTSKHNLPMGLINDGDDWHNDHIQSPGDGPMVRTNGPTCSAVTRQAFSASCTRDPSEVKMRSQQLEWQRLCTSIHCKCMSVFLNQTDRQMCTYIYNIYIYMYRYIEAGRTGFPWFSTFSAALAGPNWFVGQDTPSGPSSSSAWSFHCWGTRACHVHSYHNTNLAVCQNLVPL